MIEASQGLCPVCSTPIDGKHLSIPYPGKCKAGLLFNEVISCERCKVGIALPLPSEEEIEKFYAAGNYWNDGKIKIVLPKDYPGYYALAKARWSFIKEYLLKTSSQILSRISMLDIGAGHGFMGMIAAKDKQVTLTRYGVTESDTHALNSLQTTWQKLFAYIPYTATTDLRDVKERYNIVILSHIIEHLPNPRQFLEQVSEKISEDGLLFIEVPNEDHRFKLDVFPHLLFFNEKSLRRLVVSLGFEILAMACFGKNRQSSPLSSKPKILGNGIAKIISHLRAYLPSDLGPRYYGYYFGAAVSNQEGTWIRLIAQKKYD